MREICVSRNLACAVLFKSARKVKFVFGESSKSQIEYFFKRAPPKVGYDRMREQPQHRQGVASGHERNTNASKTLRVTKVPRIGGNHLFN